MQADDHQTANHTEHWYVQLTPEHPAKLGKLKIAYHRLEEKMLAVKLAFIWNYA